MDSALVQVMVDQQPALSGEPLDEFATTLAAAVEPTQNRSVDQSDDGYQCGFRGVCIIGEAGEVTRSGGGELGGEFTALGGLLSMRRPLVAATDQKAIEIGMLFSPINLGFDRRPHHIER